MTIDVPESGSPAIAGDATFPVNRGRLCVKGFTAAGTLGHRERLTRPLVRNASGLHEETTWDAALARVAAGVRSVQQRYDRDAVGVYGSGALTNEKAYLLGKFARVALRTSRIDYNGRFCMSSAAAASNRAFGIDRGLPFPVADIAQAEVVLIGGGNVAETMPPLMQYLDAQRKNGGKLIVVDPRLSATAQAATHHLPIAPGTDAVLAHGLLHLLIREGLTDEAYIAERTEGFEAVRSMVAGFWPMRVERITGMAEETLAEVARLLGSAKIVMVLTGRGPEQQAQGVANAGAYINLALALGMPGKPFSGYGCITGQGNGQGGREHGQKADQLPGYRHILDPAARAHVADVWGIDESELPGTGVSAQELLQTAGTDEGIRALFVFGANPAVSAADGMRVSEALSRLDLLVVSDFFLSETALLADVVFPSAQWAEEEGTMTNLEGRVIRRRTAMQPPPGVPTDLQLLNLLAGALGAGDHFAHATPEQVFCELRRATAGAPADYAGISYERIDRENGVFWPCPSEDHPGTPRLFAETFPTPSGRARFSALPHRTTAEEPDAKFPLYLTTGRLLAHYQTGTQTRRVDRLNQMAGAPTVQVHPETARAYALAANDRVALTTRRSTAHFQVEITPKIRQDTLFVPFHWGDEGSANRLTNPELDPISRMPEFKVCSVRIEKSPANGR